MNRFRRRENRVSPRVVGLRAEHHRDPLGIGTAAPRLSWRVETAAPGWSPDGVRDRRCDRDGGPVEMRTGRTRVGRTRSSCRGRPQPLASRDRRSVRVRVWGRDADEPSAWSEPLVVEAGLLEPGRLDGAGMIAADLPLPGGRRRAGACCCAASSRCRPRRSRARLYVTALGVVRGGAQRRAGRRPRARPRLDQLPPPAALPDLRRDRPAARRAPTRSAAGSPTAGTAAGSASAAAGATIYGDRDRRCWPSWRSLRRRPHRRGRHRRATGAPRPARSWRPASTTASATTPAASRAGWSAPGFDDRGLGRRDRVSRSTRPRWSRRPARRCAAPRCSARSRSAPRRPGGRSSTSARTSSAGCGSGSAARPADVVPLRHAEVLAGRRAVHPAAARRRGDRRVHPARRRRRRSGSRGSPSTASATPRSTAGPARSTADDVEAVVCHSDMARTGWFDCSDPLLDRLHENVVWSMRGNFLDVPTDCPQRDERLGWTGDIAVFAPTAAFLYDCAGLLTSWLADLAAEQAELGTVPFYVPWVELLGAGRSRPRSGATPRSIVPWVLLRALRRHRRAARPVRRACAPGSTRSPASPARAGCGTPGSSSATGSTRPPRRTGRPTPAPTRTWSPPPRCARSARTAGPRSPSCSARRPTTAATPRWPPRSRAAFNDEFVTPSGRLASDAQTAYALALTADLLAKADQRERAGAPAGRAGRGRAATTSAPASSARR